MVLDAQPTTTPDDAAPAADAGGRVWTGEGRLADLDHATRRGGQVAGEMAWALLHYCEETDFGHVVLQGGLPCGQTVRDPDLQVIGFDKIPKGPLPAECDGVVPDVAIEVRGPGDAWGEMIVRAGEWLKSGVGCFVLLDPDTSTARLFHASAPNEIVAGKDAVRLPGVLPNFEISAARLFD